MFIKLQYWVKLTLGIPEKIQTGGTYFSKKNPGLYALSFPNFDLILIFPDFLSLIKLFSNS